MPKSPQCPGWVSPKLGATGGGGQGLGLRRDTWILALAGRE